MEKIKPPTAKEILMEAASLNPAYCITCVIVNGQVRSRSTSAPIPDLLLMMEILRRDLQKSIDAALTGVEQLP